MFGAIFGRLERGDHRQDRLAVLDCLHAPCREMVAIADAIDFVNDRQFHIARPQKIRMQRMRHAAFDRARRRHQRLADHLSAEYAFAAEIARLAAKQVHFQRFEIEQCDEVLQRAIHVRFRKCE
jgi:hypothetical protein